MAILLVLGRHSVISPEHAGVFFPLAGVWGRFGWAGVDLFFVLSGFLVGGLLFNELKLRAAIDVRRFMVRRCFKIWPSYYAYLCFLLLFLSLHPGGSFAREGFSLIPSFLHVQNYFPMPRTHLWSLAVEEHFYFMLPILLAGLTVLPVRHGSPKIIPITLIGMISLCIVYRCLVNAARPFTFETHFNPTQVRLDALLFGVLLAYWHAFYPLSGKLVSTLRKPLLIIGAFCLAPMMILKLEITPFVSTIGYTMLYLGFGAILVALVSTPIGCGRLGWLLGTRPARMLAFVGGFSYPVYLWHEDLAQNPVRSWLEHGFLANISPSLAWFVATSIYVVLALGTGMLLAMLIEKPALALRNRLFPSRLQGQLLAAR